MRMTISFDTLKQQKDRDEDSSDDFFEDHHVNKETFAVANYFGKKDSLKYTKSIMYIILAFLAMATTGVTFVCSIMAYNATAQRTWHINQIVTNWKMRPIVSITSTNETYCPKGYDPIINKLWPGTFAGWYWDNTVIDSKLRNTLVIDAWDTIQSSNGWRTLKEQNPILLRKFFPGYLICVERQGIPITEMEKPFQNGKWPDNQKVWGPTDKKHYQIWVNEKDEWPIIDILFDVKRNSTPDGYSLVDLGKYALYYSSNTDHGTLPIVEFILSEGNSVCIDPKDVNKDPNKILYPLLNDNFYKGCLTNIEGIKYDSRWEDQTSVTEWDLYQNNPIYQDTLNSLPLYINKTQMQSTKYSLFQRTYIKWSQKWEENEKYQTKNLAENLNPINTLVNAQLFYMVVCFLGLIVMGIATPIFVIIRHCMVLRGENREVYKDVIISTGIRFVSMIIIILKGWFLISWLVLINKFQTISNYANDHTCSDDTTLFVMKYVDEYLEYAKRYNWVSFSAIITVAIFEIVFIVILYFLQRKSMKELANIKEDMTQSNRSIQ